jgi:hypothetical protein
VLAQFERDVHLVFANALLFNEPDSDIGYWYALLFFLIILVISIYSFLKFAFTLHLLFLILFIWWFSKQGQEAARPV